MSVQKSKVSSTRVIYISGNVNGCIKRLPLVCVRKNAIRKRKTRGSKKIKSRKIEVLGMVSHPTLSRSKTAPYISAWCHPYRHPENFIKDDKPKLLLSESDFIDPMYVTVLPRRQISWDFFCFTMGGPKSGKRKGFSLFMDILPSLHARKFKVILINYTYKNIHFKSREHKRIWRRCKSSVTYLHKKLSAVKVARIMASSRFGLFPNLEDCSPLLLTESIIRGVPILVNENILGGWKYVNENTGALFTRDRIDSALDCMIDGNFRTEEYFMANYGFIKSARLLAKFGRKHLKSFKHCKYACFEGLSHILKKTL